MDVVYWVVFDDLVGGVYFGGGEPFDFVLYPCFCELMGDSCSIWIGVFCWWVFLVLFVFCLVDGCD